MPHHADDGLPIWTWIGPLAASVLLIGKYAGLLDTSSTMVAMVGIVLLGVAVFAAVHHAEVVALYVGEPFGSIILAVAVTVIEVALIVSIMLTAASGGEAIARDTVFAAVMIVLNGVVGMCLVFGGARHHEQMFQERGAAAALSVLGTLAVIVLVLPNYTRATFGPTFAPAQLILIATVSLALYGVFLFVQTVRHRDYFLTQAKPLADQPDSAQSNGSAAPDDHPIPTQSAMWLSLALLLVSLVAVVLLTKSMSPLIERSVAAAGLPAAFVGVVIAALVLLPESMAAVRAARANQLQTSLNLALGSALASIALTIPAVAALSIILGIQLVLGLAPAEMVLLILTLFISTLTLATGRTTILQGAVHLVIFAVFLFLAAVP
jgi:Ca2+:H+ antiporter